MESKNTVMQEIFASLTENNKDIMILVAKGMDIAQKYPKQECVAANQAVKAQECIEV